MKALRYSKQREVIYEALASTLQHPTAEMLYQELKPQYPSLSLGTVYRNLNQLTEMGRAVRMSFDVDRYDAGCHPHPHFWCTQCKSLYDVDVPMDNDLTQAVNALGHHVQRQDVTFQGICQSCKAAQEHFVYPSAIPAQIDFPQKKV